MSSRCTAILWASRSGLSDRTTPASALEGLDGLIFVTRIDHPSTCVFCFFTSLGS